MLQFTKKVVFLCICVIWCCACEEDVDFKGAEYTPKIVVYSIFTQGKPVEVFLTKNYGIHSSIPNEYISMAEVELYRGDEFIEELTVSLSSNPRIPPSFKTIDFLPEMGVEYTLRAKVDGFKEVEAMSYIPMAQPLAKLELVEFTSKDLGLETIFDYTLAVGIIDKPVEENYYHLNIYQQVYDFAGLQTDTLNKLITFSNKDNNNNFLASQTGGVLLSDEFTYDHFELDVSVSVNPDFQELGKVIAELRSVSKEYYLFHTSSTRQNLTQGNFFNEPVFLYNNIKNGIGTFSGYNIYSDSLSIEF